MNIMKKLIRLFLILQTVIWSRPDYGFAAGEKPSLLPMPQHIEWHKGYFSLYACKAILVKDTALQKEALRLQMILKEKGLAVDITDKEIPGRPVIELWIGEVTARQLSEEAYRLHVKPEKIMLTANAPHGIFNGIQTLAQLAGENKKIEACTITDWPAFSWRGYMVDVGRNFQSIELLKQQIDIMAKYKLNIFHFHPTEDIAWRLEIPGYPQLTAPENMLRDKGSYYSVQEFKDLIEYCKERYITLVPEIDMPGHSAAFTRAMGTDMQSSKGAAIVKDILEVFCKTYDVPYVHIGGDEVEITNKDFLPEMTALLHHLGKKTIGWEPGGNLEHRTIRQLWMTEGAKDTTLTYIDSRHLYLNHMDPLESVVTIFNRQIGDRNKEDKDVMGGIICLWNDRKVNSEADLLRMNPVYPAMLAFAERSWRGGGNAGWTAIIGTPGTEEVKEFAEFENRLLNHKKRYFSSLPFPYAKQTDIVWNLYGPYQNNGDLTAGFKPETEGFNYRKEVSLQAVGGTIVLRHWWAPAVKGYIPHPKENTTWYARTTIWSDKDKTVNAWIGFNNISRSPNTDSPQPGTWDNRQSKIWVNGKIIEPPAWKHAGQKGDSEIPLIDEGYEYRPPAEIKLQKGFNAILVKLPVGSFKGPDWHNPVKWMFTFLPLQE